MTAGLPLMKSVLTSLAKSALLSFGLSAEISATDTATQKKIYESDTAALIISNEETEYIMKIIRSPEESGLLIKGISEQLKMKQKNKKGDVYQCY